MPEPQALTPRENDVLDAIGRRLSNPEIAAELVVSLRTVESHVASLRRKLAASSRAELRAAALARGRPSPVATRILGRDTDLASLRSALDVHRLVTLSGPPGCGKSRLAAEVARGRAAVLVDVDGAGTDLVAALASQLGVPPSDVGGLDAACLVLDAGVDLLVLDDGDHRPEECARLARAVVHRTRRTVVLLTSRAPLGSPEEVVRPLRPLTGDPERHRAAVELFVERALAAGADPADLDPVAVGRLCERLDGLPLALELAAARCGTLPLVELEPVLEPSLDLLSTRAGGRHATLTAAVGWSVDRLDATERRALVGLCSLPADLPLADVDDVLGAGALAAALRLVDLSLATRRRGPGGTASIGVLRTVRDVVLPGATADDGHVVDGARRAWCDLVERRTLDLAARCRTDDSPEAHRVWRALADALPWVLDGLAATDVRRTGLLACAVGALAEQYGPDAATCSALAALVHDAGVVDALAELDADLVGDGLAFGHLAAAAVLARAVGTRDAIDVDARLRRARLSGVLAMNTGRSTDALADLAETERLAQQVDDGWRLAFSLQGQGMAHQDLGEVDAAWACFDRAVAAYADVGDAMHVNNVRYMMCALAAATGRRTGEALAWADQCVAYGEDRDNRHELAHAWLVRARLRSTLGSAVDVDELERARAAFAAVGDARCLARALLLLAGLDASDADGPDPDGSGLDDGSRVDLLQSAWRAARTSGKPELMTSAASALSAALVACGDVRGAGLVLGALAAVVGEDAAVAAAPAVDGVSWDPLVAEGRARERGAAST